MNESRDLELPVHGKQAAGEASEDEPSCSPKVYVTNEEVALLGAIRRLMERAVTVRERLNNATSAEERTALEAELETLRGQRDELAESREQAYRRKMVMLGHLPPDAMKE